MSLPFPPPFIGDPDLRQPIETLWRATKDIETRISTLSGGGGFSVVDAKGDLIVGTADNTVDNLTVGANNTLLVADSAQTTGTKWATAPDAALTSANNSVYKTLLVSSGLIGVDATAGTFMLGTKVNGFAPSLMAKTSDTITIGNDGLPPDLIYFDDADYTVGGLTQKLRLRATLLANATAPGTMTFIFGLYPVTVAGGADALAYTYGSVVGSSQVTLTNPAASTVTTGVNADFTIPSDGAYALGVVTNATIANNSIVSCHAQLQTRNV